MLVEDISRIEEEMWVGTVTLFTEDFDWADTFSWVGSTSEFSDDFDWADEFSWAGSNVEFTEDFETGWYEEFVESFEDVWSDPAWKGDVLEKVETFESEWSLPPLVQFSGSPLSGPNPFLTTFVNETIHYSANIAYYWTFGDGGHSALENPTHNYNNPGTFTVALIVSDLSGKVTKTKVGYVVAS